MLQAGARLGDRYVLLELVARGGMGEVWRADDTVLGRVVAVKVLLPSLSGEPGFAQRFHTEARAMAALSDPNIVEVYDYGQTDGVAYLVMQFVPGEPLHALLRRVGPLPPHQAMTLVAQAARALHQAHIKGIVHRDVKPGNLLIRPDGRLVLTDFGIARLVAGDRLTVASDIIGTASYVSPEQVSGGPITPATDVYALGVVAYECLTVTRPFVADTPITVAIMHTRDAPPPLPNMVPESVRHVVMRALAKDPRQRWGSAAAMAQAAMAAAAEVGPGNGPAPVPVVPGRRPTGMPATGGSLAGMSSGPLSPPRPSSSRLTMAPPPPSSSRLTTPRVPTQPVGRAQPRSHTQPGPPPRRRRLAWLVAAAVVVLTGLGWFAFNGSTGGGVEAVSSHPPTTSSSVDTPSPSPSARSASPSPSATPSRQTTAAGPGPAAATTSQPPATPGPDERLVPDVRGKYGTEADYALYAIGLGSEFTYETVPGMCSVTQQDPAPNTIVPLGTVVRLVLSRSDPDCEPV